MKMIIRTCARNSARNAFSTRAEVSAENPRSFGLMLYAQSAGCVGRVNSFHLISSSRYVVLVNQECVPAHASKFLRRGLLKGSERANAFREYSRGRLSIMILRQETNGARRLEGFRSAAAYRLRSGQIFANRCKVGNDI